MKTEVGRMTRSEIDASIRELQALAESGKITADQSVRLVELRQARRHIERAYRPTPWWR